MWRYAYIYIIEGRRRVTNTYIFIIYIISDYFRLFYICIYICIYIYIYVPRPLMISFCMLLFLHHWDDDVLTLNGEVSYCLQLSSATWWRHQMETFSAQLALCAGNSPVPVNSPHKGQWRGTLMFSLICVWINGWVNNREAGDLRRHSGHYDVNVMTSLTLHQAKNNDCSVKV